MIELEADFDLCFTVMRVCRENAFRVSMLVNCAQYCGYMVQSQCSAVTFLTRFYKYTPNPFIPQTLLTYFPTRIHKQTHQLALHNIRLSFVHTHTHFCFSTMEIAKTKLMIFFIP